MSGQYEVGGNVGHLQSLAAEQQGYLNQFNQILGEINNAAQSTLSQWDGAAKDGYSQGHREYDQHYQAVQAAFNKLNSATSDAASQYSALIGKMNNLFPG
ncbi:WXG100 family type VII secretion target [Fodinicola acaciae]|uniref:WXG100 family type VII secretion target n=1 Tax=Fodinicola acaciae TaxID=2681555 RepID=UPI0013D7A8B6|nr:WXG100 family type VII secretion target [Fodinicola acaciae]